jgi:peroxiredoxin Q/BCP
MVSNGLYLEAVPLSVNPWPKMVILLKQFDVSYFMASVDPLEKNTAFAESTKADFPSSKRSQSKEVAKAYDVLSALSFFKKTYYLHQ